MITCRLLLLVLITALVGLADRMQSERNGTSLTLGAVIENRISGKEPQLYRLGLAAGECAVVDIEQRGVDVVAQILDEHGESIAEFDGESRKQGHEHIVLVADQSRDYLISIKARYAKDPEAAYRVQVKEIRAAAEKDRALYSAYQLSTAAKNLNEHGKYDDALQHAESAVAEAEKAVGPNDAYVGSLLTQLGYLQRRKGDYAKAEQTDQRAVAVEERALGKEDPKSAAALAGLGLLYMSMNEYGKAELLLGERLDIIERTLGNEHPTMVTCLLDLSLLHQNREDLDRALAELKRALPIAQKRLDDDDFFLIAVTHNLGNLYISMQDYEAAKPLLERALAMIEKRYGPEHPNVANPLQNLGTIARRNREYPLALTMFWRAQAVREKALGPQHPDTIALLINIANVYASEGDYAKGIQLDQQALGMLNATVGPYHHLTLSALVNLARFYAAEGDLQRAVEYQRRYDEGLEKNIDLNAAIGSEREKLAYLDFVSQHTERTISLHVQLGQGDEAACELAALVVLQRHGRVLDVLSASRAALRRRLTAEDGELLDELDQKSAKLARIALSGPAKTPAAERQKQLDDLEQQREKLESEVSRLSPEFQAQSHLVTLSTIRATIPPGAALIEFAAYRPFDPKHDIEEEAYGEARYVAYVICREGNVRWRDLGRVKDVDAEVLELRTALRDPARKDVKEIARKLDRAVAQPLRGLVGDATQLLLAPDGALNLIPFDALVDEHQRFLVERYSITYLGSGRDLLRMQPSRASKSGPLLLADPLFGDASAEPKLLARAGSRRSITTAGDLSDVYFAPLAGTAVEARSIKELFPGANVLTGRQASVAALKAADAPLILHIATHGFFLQSGTGTSPHKASQLENPLLRSGLALAGSNVNRNGTREGIFTALEASGLNLWGTKLVTLSACDSGVGEVRNGEGVYGLRRAFVLAGAETLVMSLWPVSDYVTRALMTAYYSGLQRGMGRGAALRQAQLSLLRREGRQHPFYWASFIQSGDWRNLEGE